MSREDPEETESVDGQSEETESTTHLAGIEDGAGCTEIWEHLSRSRDPGEETKRGEADDD